MSRTDDSTHGWLRQAVNQPEFAARLAPLATGAREVVVDHCAEAFLGGVVIAAAAGFEKARVWRVSDMPRHRERLAAELELCGLTALVLVEMELAMQAGKQRVSRVPRKIRDLLNDLQKAGFTLVSGGKGSHRKFHSEDGKIVMIVPGHDGDDAQNYLEKQVKKKIEKSQL